MEFGNAFSYTFTRVGIYQYYCQLHGDMIGEVDVR
jgi:plastocyanin